MRGPNWVGTRLIFAAYLMVACYVAAMTSVRLEYCRTPPPSTPYLIGGALGAIWPFTALVAVVGVMIAPQHGTLYTRDCPWVEGS